MTQTTSPMRVHVFYTLRKDVGVALVFLAALALAFVLRGQTEGRTTTFKDSNSPFSIAYPATWGRADALSNALLKVENPRTDSVFKTSLTVISRELDPQNPPTLQQLVDRRVAQQGSLTGYHFLSSDETTVGGAKAMRLEYAYIAQPLDQPRRASLPVVVHAIEHIVAAKNNAYFIALAAPENDFADASVNLSEILPTVKVQ